MRVVYDTKMDIKKITEDIYKKIGIQSFHITNTDNYSFILNNKYKVQILNNDSFDSPNLIYRDKQMNYAVYKYVDNNTKLEKIS